MPDAFVNTDHYGWHFSNLTEYLCVWVWVCVPLTSPKNMVLSNIIFKKRQQKSQISNLIYRVSQGVVDCGNWNWKESFIPVQFN